MTKSEAQQLMKQTFKELKEMEDYLHHTKMEIAHMIIYHMLDLGVNTSQDQAKLLKMSTHQRFCWTEGDIDSLNAHELEGFIKTLKKVRKTK